MQVTPARVVPGQPNGAALGHRLRQAGVADAIAAKGSLGSSVTGPGDETALKFLQPAAKQC